MWHLVDCAGKHTKGAANQLAQIHLLECSFVFSVKLLLKNVPHNHTTLLIHHFGGNDVEFLRRMGMEVVVPKQNSYHNNSTHTLH